MDDTCFPFSVCFGVFDSDGDSFLSRSEIEVMCKALIEIRKENAGEKVIKPNWLMTESGDDTWEFDNKDLERHSRFLKLECSWWLTFLWGQVDTSLNESVEQSLERGYYVT